RLELPRPDGARAPGGMGRLAGGLPPDQAVQVVELARQLRRRGLARPEVGRGVRRWRSHLPKARRTGESMTARHAGAFCATAQYASRRNPSGSITKAA